MSYEKCQREQEQNGKSFFDGFGVMLFLVCYEVKGHNYTEGIGNCGDGVGLCGGGKRFPILYTARPSASHAIS